MKKLVFTTLLMLCLVLSLAACGQNKSNTNSTPGSMPESSMSDGSMPDSPMPDSSMPDSSMPEGSDAEEAEAISGIVNRLDSYLVLLDDEGNYLVFDFGDDVDQKALAEGDRVTVTYTGELGSENPAPVAVDIQVAP